MSGDVLDEFNSTLYQTSPAGCMQMISIVRCCRKAIVPVDERSQQLFAFTYRGTQFTWSHLVQGYVDSAAVFSAVVHTTLKDIVLPPDTCLLQYADDLLITGPSHKDCENASIIVCNVLASAGFKASR